MFLSSIRRKPGYAADEVFPWTLPLIRNLDELEFKAPITFFVGENGAGKSTLLEGIAAGMDAAAVGSEGIRYDETLIAARELARGFTFVRKATPQRKVFMRAEDVFGFTKRLQNEMQELKDMAEDFRTSFAEGTYAQMLAVGTAEGQRHALISRYGENPDARSHGEAFLAILQARLFQKGLYFLDEPEGPMAPTRILALMILLREGVAKGSQFVITTHSPILMAMPGSEVFCFEDGRIERKPYEEVEHVRITKAFLDNPELFLEHLEP